jgi:hypothetical protein
MSIAVFELILVPHLIAVFITCLSSFGLLKSQGFLDGAKYTGFHFSAACHFLNSENDTLECTGSDMLSEKARIGFSHGSHSTIVCYERRSFGSVA